MLVSVAIVEEFLGNNTAHMIAKTVLKAQDIYENSWDNDNHKYHISHGDAADKACTDVGLSVKWSKYISHWNSYIWNDIHWWAKTVLR